MELLDNASCCHFHLQCSRLVARSTKCKASALAHTKEIKKIHKFSGKGHSQGCSGAATRWNAVPVNILEPERRSGKYRWPQVER